MAQQLAKNLVLQGLTFTSVDSFEHLDLPTRSLNEADPQEWISPYNTETREVVMVSAENLINRRHGYACHDTNCNWQKSANSSK